MSKLHFNISAFTKHLPLKVLDFSKELNLSCSVHGKANTHKKSYFCMTSTQTLLFQKAQHQWTNTLKEQCSHLNVARIFSCKNLSKTGAHSRIRSGMNLLNILLWKYNTCQNWRTLSIRTGILQSMLHAKLNTLKESWGNKSCTFKGKCSYNAANFICDL